jgi:hypothetical protein
METISFAAFAEVVEQASEKMREKDSRIAALEAEALGQRRHSSRGLWKWGVTRMRSALVILACGMNKLIGTVQLAEVQ